MECENRAIFGGQARHTTRIKDILPAQCLRKNLRNYRRAFKTNKGHLAKFNGRSSQKKTRRAAERYDIRKCSRKGKTSLNKDLIKQKKIEKMKLISESAYIECIQDRISESSMTASCASLDLDRKDDFADFLFDTRSLRHADLQTAEFFSESESLSQKQLDTTTVKNRRKSSAEFRVHCNADIHCSKSFSKHSNLFDMFQDERRMKMIVEEDNEIDWGDWNYWGLEKLFGKIESSVSTDSLSDLPSTKPEVSTFCYYCLESSCNLLDCQKIWSENEADQEQVKTKQTIKLNNDLIKTPHKESNIGNDSFNLIKTMSTSGSYFNQVNEDLLQKENEVSYLPQEIKRILDSGIFHTDNVIDEVLKLNQNYEELNRNLAKEFPSIKQFSRRIKKNFSHRKIKRNVNKNKKSKANQHKSQIAKRHNSKWENFFNGNKLKVRNNLIFNPLIFKSCHSNPHSFAEKLTSTPKQSKAAKSNELLKSLIKARPRFVLQKKRKSSLIDPNDSENENSDQDPIFLMKCPDYETFGYCQLNSKCPYFHRKQLGLKYSELKRCLFNLIFKQLQVDQNFQLDKIMNRFYALQPPLAVFEKCLFRRPEKNVFEFLQIE